jgi:hypothetical protein
MTDTPPVDLSGIGPPPGVSREGAAVQPLMLYQGQPWSRESAAAQRAKLMADPEYAQAAINGDVSKQIELKDLWMLERGLEPSPPPATTADVNLQALDREQRDYLLHDAALRQRFDLTDEQRHEIIHQRPQLQVDKDTIAERHARNMRSEAFQQRLREREPGAVRDDFIASWMRRAPLAHSSADIAAWQAAHPFTAKQT